MNGTDGDTAGLTVFTSRYSCKAIPDSGLMPVGITLGTPRFRLNYEKPIYDRRFGPHRAIFDLPDAEFRRAYIDLLDIVLGDEALAVLQGYHDQAVARGYRGIVLLCFEDVRNPETPCHRTDLAHWLHERFGLVVEELEDPELPKTGRQRPPYRKLAEAAAETQPTWTQRNLW